MPRPRNVIWITADHLRYDNLGANGNPAMCTPNLDRLSAHGVAFDRCYGQNPLCMPSRASFMTGCYPQQTGVTENGRDLPADFPLAVARCFGAGGWRTVQLGKLHFEHHEDHDLDPRQRNDYGFDQLALSEEPGCYDDAYIRWLRSEHPALVETFTIPRPMAPARCGGEKPVVLDAPWECSHSGWVAEQAVRNLTAWAGTRGTVGGNFLHLGFYAPHPPLNPTREMMAPYEGVALPPPIPATEPGPGMVEPLAGMFRRGATTDPAFAEAYRRHFYAMVTGIDLAVGRLLEALEGNGTLDDTLIVVGSDHGDYCGDHGCFAKGPTFLEPLMRLPLVLHWPKGLGRGRRVAGLVEMVDVLPTLLGLAGAPVPALMQGRDLSAALLAGRDPAPREDVYAIHEPGHLMVRTDRYKYLRFVAGEGCTEVLFDLEEDPTEVVNLAVEPACQELLHEMRNRALARSVNASRSILKRNFHF